MTLTPTSRGLSSLASIISACLLVAQAGCASRSPDVRPVHVDAKIYREMSCERLYDELDRTEIQAVAAAEEVDSRFADNAALILVSGLVWPAALALRADGDQARRLGVLRGQHEALQREVGARPCPKPQALSSVALATELALRPGDRYTYQVTDKGTNELTVAVSAVRNERIEFDAGQWAQDLAGNRLPTASVFASGTPPADPPQPGSTLPYVVRLLEPRLRLGQSLKGVLFPGGEALPLAVTGEVVALGPATLSQASLPTATVELEGWAIEPMTGNGSSRRTVHGVMVVDSRNGMLVRLQIEPSPALAAMDVRLLRVDRKTNVMP